MIGSGEGRQSYQLLSPEDIYERKVLQDYIPLVPRYEGLSWMKKIPGRYSKRKTNRFKYSFYEKQEWFKSKAKIGAISGSGPFTITLATESHESLNGTNNVSYPVENNLVVFNDGRTHGFIESTNKTTDGAHQIVVKPTSASMDIASVAVQNSTMVFYSNGQPERSTQTKSRVPRFERKTNYVQTIRQKFDVADHEAQNVLEFQVENGTRYLYYEGINETWDRFQMDCDLAHLLAPGSENLTDANAENVDLMKGLIPQIEDEGNTFYYYNRPDFTDFQAYNLKLKANFGAKTYMLGQGQQIRQAQSSWLTEFAKAGTANIDFSVLGKNGQTTALNVGLEAVHIDGYSYFMKEFEIFSHPSSLGDGDMPYNDMEVFIPLGYTSTYDRESTNEMIGIKSTEPLFQCVYSVPDVDSRHLKMGGQYAMWETGAGARGGATNDVMERNVHFIGYHGNEIYKINQFAVVRKA